MLVAIERWFIELPSVHRALAETSHLLAELIVIHYLRRVEADDGRAAIILFFLPI
jgi:hypothetical protein